MPEPQTKIRDIKFDFVTYITKSYETQQDGQGQEEGDRIIEGFVTTNDLDTAINGRVGDIVTEGAIDKSIPLFLERPILLFNHHEDIPIGTILEARKEKTKDGSLGLWIKALISKTENGFWQKIKEGILNKFSFKFLVPEDDIVLEWDDTLKKMVRKILSFLPIESSLVTVPANAKARSIAWYIQKAIDEDMEVLDAIDMDLMDIEKEEKTKGGFSMDELAKLKEEMSVEFTKQIETINSQFAADKETLTKQLSDVTDKLAMMEQKELKEVEDAQKARDEEATANTQIEIKKNLSIMEDTLAMAEEAEGKAEGDVKDLLVKIVDALKGMIATYPEKYPTPAKSIDAIEPAVEVAKSFDMTALNETIQKSIQAAVTKGLG